MVSLVLYVDSAIVLIFLLNSVLGNNKQACDINTIVYRQCSPTETCVPTADLKNGFCECQPGHTRVNGSFCSNVTALSNSPTPKSSSLVDEESGKTSEDKGNGHVVAGVLIPIFLITVVISGVYFSRKYNVVGYIRSKMWYQRSSGNYDEVMIGQDLDEEDDDPPLR